MTVKSDIKMGAGEHRIPWITIGIIVVNTLLAVVTRQDMLFYSEVCAKVYGLMPSDFRPGSLLTSAFLHDGFVHLAINMILLYCFGSQVERVMGRLEYMIFYLASCFVASLAHVAIVYASMPDYYLTRAVVGASGAVAAIMGVYAVRFHRRVFNLAGVEIPALLIIMGWLVLQLALGILSLYQDNILGLGLKQVGYWSHLGGFAFGVIVALIANMAVTGEREYLNEQAEANCEAGNLLEAIQNHQTILEYEPANADSHAETARLWALLDEKDDSLRFYQMAIQLFVSQGLEDRALQVAEEMAVFWPGSKLSATARFRLATYLEETGDTERALEEFQSITDDEPDSVEAQMSLLKVAELELNDLGRPQAAEMRLRQFIERYPTSEWLRFARETLSETEQTGPPTPTP